MSTSQEPSRKEKLHMLLNRKRKADTAAPNKKEDSTKPADEATKPKQIATDPLIEKAKKKLLLETKLAKERAERMGPQGWLRPKSLNTNKQFLKRTLQSTLRSNTSKNK